MQKSIKIITEGGQNFGFGHIVRCKALYDAFISMGQVPELIIKGDNSLLSILQNSQYKFINWHNSNKELLSICKGADICIIDSYIASEGIYTNLSKASKKFVVFDDTNRLNYPKRTIIINGLLHISNDLYNSQIETENLLGITYQSVRTEFRTVPQKIISDEISSIIITVGGNDIRNIVPFITKISKEVYPQSQIHIIIGTSSDNYNSICNLADNILVFVYSNADVNQVVSLMKNADFVISAAGQTLCELACCGVPGISISVIDNQLEHAKSWDQEGCFDFVGSWESIIIENNMRILLQNNASKEIRQTKSRKMQSIIDGKGAIRIAEFLL